MVSPLGGVQETAEAVCGRYGLEERFLQAVQERAGHFASGVVAFCARMSYDTLSGALSVFVVSRPAAVQAVP